jgi:hypothetical protein
MAKKKAKKIERTSPRSLKAEEIKKLVEKAKESLTHHPFHLGPSKPELEPTELECLLDNYADAVRDFQTEALTLAVHYGDLEKLYHLAAMCLEAMCLDIETNLDRLREVIE